MVVDMDSADSKKGYSNLYLHVEDTVGVVGNFLV
jgi:hypothetical protein